MRTFFSAALLGSVMTLAFATHAVADEPLAVTLHKDPWCGCCNAYADYLEDNGFKVTRIDHQDMAPVKRKLGTAKAASCHTVEIDGYVVEGHVPVAAINRMLKERPDILGITLPGMPLNSPGMGPEKPGSLEVLSLDRQGRVTGLYQRL
mgnify:CR=1 FL=1